MKLAGKVALVSGAGGGIGRAITLAFIETGAAVACCDIDAASAEETARLALNAGGRAIARACDVSVEADTETAVAALYQAFGRLDILVSAPLLTIPAARSSRPDLPTGSGSSR
jgi:NAD(P)-dependent dehydrogenase (short-subunit alcohol dehydrogenase family)